MKGIVLAAGKGTRLKPLTNLCAKPALPILGIPTFWFNAWHLSKSIQNKELAINCSHLPESIIHATQDKDLGKFTKINFHISNEMDLLLGSSGALWKLKAWIGSDRTIVCNGDSICFPNLSKMIAFHEANKASITIHVFDFKSHLEEFTQINIGSGGEIESFGRKSNSGQMFSGYYIIEPNVVDRLSAGVSEIKPSLFEPLCKEKKIFAYKENVAWFDTGNIQSYAETQFNLLKELPECRDLIKTKMQEISKNVWVPHSWKNLNGLQVNQPAALLGNKLEWVNISKQYGPNFIGIEPSIQPVKTQDCIIYKNLQVEI